MRWFRGHSRLTAWAALVAIALQLVLAFGHVHHEAFDHASKIAALASGNPDGRQPNGPAAPADHDDYCPVCAVLSLLAGALTADAPPLPAPLTVATVTVATAPETVRSTGARAAFQSRAPPLS